MKRYALFLLLCIVGLAGQSQNNTTGPLRYQVLQQWADQPDDVSGWLRHLLASDHKDRLSGMSKGAIWRDKMRVSIVYFWYQKGRLHRWQDEYAAALILMRAGTPHINNPTILEAAYVLFWDVYHRADQPVVREEAWRFMTHVHVLLENPSAYHVSFGCKG